MLASVSIFVYSIYIDKTKGGAVKQTEFVRWLAEQGATFKQGTKHLKVYLNGKQTTVPRHPGKEIDDRFVREIKKQLNIK
ncbi:type II toxin-antitoxin system HicA family toxin [Massilia sp. TN1-12]|uniref:type II toxin-antitoxin system HicA family toxin n=1 Tax=Massilia paldalensis TaxID=3377675 RepID=UPI00384DFD43